MIRLILLSISQAALLAGGQVLMKLALRQMSAAEWSWAFVRDSLLMNVWWPLCGATFASAGLLWMYILKHYPFSVAYPLSSIAYVFGMIAAWLVFKEQIQWTQWLGILLIMAGCYFVAK